MVGCIPHAVLASANISLQMCKRLEITALGHIYNYFLCKLHVYALNLKLPWFMLCYSFILTYFQFYLFLQNKSAFHSVTSTKDTPKMKYQRSWPVVFDIEHLFAFKNIELILQFNMCVGHSHDNSMVAFLSTCLSIWLTLFGNIF